MPNLTAYPNGVSSFGIPIYGSGGGVPFTTGKYVFVSSLTGAAGGNGKTPGTACATIAQGLLKCNANKGDVIILMPGHAATIASAGGLTINVAGVTIVGVGTGSLRPVFTFSATDSTIAISAANVTLSNVITTVSIDEVVSMFNVTGANCTLDRVDFQPYGALGATGQAIQWLLTSAAASYLTVQNCRHYQYTAATANQVWMDLNGLTAPRVLDNTAYLLAKAATATHWIGTTAACNQVEIANNRVLLLGATTTGVITMATGTTGLIYNNYLGSGTAVGATTAIVADAAFVFENYWIDDAAASGILTPAAGTD
jgi:hypothetical protein